MSSEALDKQAGFGGSVSDTIQQADLLEENGALEQAEALLLQALKQHGFAVDLHLKLINISSRLKHFDIAIQCCQALLDDDDCGEYWYLYAQTQERMQDWHGAKSNYLKALDYGYDTVRVYYRLATICNLLEQEEASLTFYQQALPRFAAEEENHKDGLGFYNEWVTTLIRCEQYVDTLALLFRVIDIHKEQRLGLDKLIRRLHGVWMQAGLHFESLWCYILLRNYAEFTELANELYLDKCVRLGYFAPEAIWLAQRVAIESAAYSHALKQAFYLLLIFFGIQPKVLNKVIRFVKGRRIDQKLLFTLSACLYHSQEDERLESFLSVQKTVDLKEFAEDVPSVAWYLLQQVNTDDDTSEKARITLDSYRRVEADRYLVWRKLYASKKVAIVSNSPCELGRQQGEEIDAHDYVVRFDNFEVTTPYDADYGTKVHMHVRPGGDVEKFDLTPPQVDIVLSGIQPWLFYHRWSTVTSLLAKGGRVVFFPEQEQKELIHRLRRAPSPGLCTAWVCAQHHPLSLTSYYGLELLNQQGEVVPSLHYWEDMQASPRHDVQGESGLIREFLQGRKP